MIMIVRNWQLMCLEVDGVCSTIDHTVSRKKKASSMANSNIHEHESRGSGTATVRRVFSKYLCGGIYSTILFFVWTDINENINKNKLEHIRVRGQDFD